MRKKLASVICFAIFSNQLFSHQALGATPAVKVNGQCNKVGSSTKLGGKTLICVKSGKKLIWITSKSDLFPTPVAAPTTASSNSPTPTPSATPTVKAQVKNQIPIVLPVAINGSITFLNAASNYNQIPQVAWQRVQDSIVANPNVDIPTTISIGPNTTADLATITSSLNRLYTLFSGFEHFSSYTGIVYNAQDLTWAQDDASSQFRKLGITGFMKYPQSIKQQSEAGCEMNGKTAVECYGGMALTFKDGGSNAGAAFYGVQNTYTGNGKNDDYWTSALKSSGPMTQVTHEGVHNYQFAQFFNKPFTSGQNTAADQTHAFTPWWYSEGQANGIGISVFQDSLKDYLTVRNQTVTRKPDSRAKLPTMTAEGFKKFLTEYQTTGPENYNWSLAYSIGFATVEALIAIGGPQSTLALYALGGNGEDWDSAFKHVYGLSWDEGADVLAKVLAAEYSAKPIER